MTPDRASRFVAIFGVCAGAALLAWWAVFAAGALPPNLAPVDVSPGHRIAEIVLGAALLLGGAVTLTDRRIGRLTLAASLGGLVYASIGALGGYLTAPPGRGFMVVLLTATLASSLAALAALSLDPAAHRGD